MGKTGILIVTICSNNKKQGGSPFDRGNTSLLTGLPEHSPALIKRRQAVLQLLREGETVRDGIKLSQMQLNSRLKLGPDFGGNYSSLYMPAYRRYIGRFFTEAGKDNPDLLIETNHHVLILSGLYGLLLPEEQIQAYSCHVEDHPRVLEIWRDGGFLTSLVLAYINLNAIKRVFDLTGQDVYRWMVDWNRIAKKLDTLHLFSEQYAGAAALPSLGELARTNLLSETEDVLLAIRPDGSIYLNDHGRIVTSRSPFPPEGLPMESKTKSFLGPIETALMDKPKVQSNFKRTTILEHSRDIPLKAGEHNTIFDKQISKISDLPPDVRDMFLDISRCPDVLEVFLGRFTSHGPKLPTFRLRLSRPQLGSGHIFGKLEGPGAIGRKQHIDIRTTQGREAEAYTVISELLSGSPIRHPVDNPKVTQSALRRKSVCPQSDDFMKELQILLNNAQNKGESFIDIVAGDLHRRVGGYPGRQHRMAVCCGVMRKLKKPEDKILNAPPKGKGATLKIRYRLPR